MAGIITISRESSGPAIEDFLSDNDKGLNHGDVVTKATTLEEIIYIRHDGLSPITNLGIYIENNSELIGWGDANSAEGLLIDIDNNGTFDANFKTGVGDSISNAIVLGSINSGQEKIIRLKVTGPGSVASTGIKKFDLRFDFDFTT